MARAKGLVPPACEKGSVPARTAGLPLSIASLPGSVPGQSGHHRSQVPPQRCRRELKPQDLLGRGKRQNMDKQRIPSLPWLLLGREVTGTGQGPASQPDPRLQERDVARRSSRQQSWKSAQLSTLLLLPKGPNQPHSEIWQAANALPSHRAIFAIGLSHKKHCLIPGHHSGKAAMGTDNQAVEEKFQSKETTNPSYAQPVLGCKMSCSCSRRRPWDYSR